MKKGMYWVAVAVLAFSFGANVEADSGSSPLAPIISATPMVKLSKNAEVFIVGSGFKPGQEIVLVYTDPTGVPANIGYALKPKPVADGKGEWATTWDCGRYVSRKLIKEGVTSIKVTDDEYNVLAHDSIFFYAK